MSKIKDFTTGRHAHDARFRVRYGVVKHPFLLRSPIMELKRSRVEVQLLRQGERELCARYTYIDITHSFL